MSDTSDVMNVDEAVLDAPEVVELEPAESRPAHAPRPRRRFFTSAFAGIDAIMAKELRGRMRGRRAFVVLTIYLLLLAGYAWIVTLAAQREFAGSGPQASALIGQNLFSSLLILETILVVLLAPSFSAGAISQEREKQTLDMLAATPISSLAIALGKLTSALTYVFMLILASIPLAALVFVFGGAGPEDVIRGYVVLVATGIGLGSVGLFFSALVRRTQAALIFTFVAIFALTQGTTFIGEVWPSIASRQQVEFRPGEQGGVFSTASRPPEALFYLNPFVAQADVVCGTETGFGEYCQVINAVVDPGTIFNVDTPTRGPQVGIDTGVGGLPGVVVEVPDPVVIADGPGFAGGGPRVIGAIGEPSEVQFGVVRDRFWPKSVAAWLILSAILIVASVQLVTPTRRWRPGASLMPRRRSIS